MSDDGGRSPSALDTLLGAAPRKRRRHLVATVVLAIAILAAIVLAVRFFAGQESPYLFAPAQIGDLEPKLAERGLVQGSHDLAIYARTSGTIASLAASSNGQVRYGQELARIDSGPLKQLLEADTASLEAAEADLAAQKAIAAQKAELLARFERVWQKSDGRVPARNEMSAARSEALRSRQAELAAEARLRAARLAVEARQEQLSDTVIRAPFSSFLTLQGAEKGQQVREGALLFRLTPEDDTLMITVPWKFAGATAKPGTRAAVRFDDLSGQTFEAKLARIDAGPEGPIGVFVLEDADDRIQPGMEAALEMTLPERRGVLLVPAAALEFSPYRSPQRVRPQIYLLGEDGTPRRVDVTVGASDGSRTEIFSNAVEPGARVIIGMRSAADN
ncbi:MAG: efflux transporter periplasmic adaptor subunit [Novosphingobium sp.]|nr:efflux transporter periplasmic adaptor subunit [Novosphingobium sp.]